MKTASVGKLLLAHRGRAAARRRSAQRCRLAERESALAVADSGLWQHLQVDNLSIDDLCVLIAGVSDNLATNVVLE